MRRIVPCAVLALAVACASAPRSADTMGRADSALVHQILDAENRRDATNPALLAGAQHADSRIRMLARRASARTIDSLFAARDSFPVLASPPIWPEPAWRLRLRAIATGRNVACSAIAAALTDSAWPVRLGAADALLRTGSATAVPVRCADDRAIVDTLLGWVRNVPDLDRRSRGGVSWHGAAHAMVALVHLGVPGSDVLMRDFARHDNAHLRRYAVRAADLRDDLPILRLLARDADANVREASIEALRKTTAQRDDSLFVAALTSEYPQVVRAAAEALAGSTNPAARAAADAAFDRWLRRAVASERDVRVALLQVAGRPVSDDRPPVRRAPVPSRAVGLAMGSDVRLRVQMAASSGGGAFVVRMRGDVAPITAARIVDVALRGDYNGLTWHRVEHDFVIQGGSPGASEYVGSAEYFRDELGRVPHVRGTVGMSTRGHDTGDAQWFVNLKDNLRLGRDYTVFGEVVSGIEIVDGVLEGDVIERIELVRD